MSLRVKQMELGSIILFLGGITLILLIAGLPTVFRMIFIHVFNDVEMTTDFGEPVNFGNKNPDSLDNERETVDQERPTVGLSRLG